MAKETVKIKFSKDRKKPYEVLKRAPEGEYHKQGSKYTLKGLLNYILNAAVEFDFDSPETRMAYETEVAGHEAEQKARKAAWEEEQNRRQGRPSDKGLDRMLAAYNMQATTLLQDMRADHEQTQR
ncbi:MAG: hypothetical protein MUF61_01825 [archaeon]|jgi:hypothetical protein|nr:hypothetical protein [archaeon]